MTTTHLSILILLAFLAVTPWLFLLLGVAEVRLKWGAKKPDTVIKVTEAPPIHMPDYYAGFDDCVAQVESQGYTVEVQNGA